MYSQLAQKLTFEGVLPNSDGICRPFPIFGLR
jgi:hypothetical protein